MSFNLESSEITEINSNRNKIEVITGLRDQKNIYVTN